MEASTLAGYKATIGMFDNGLLLRTGIITKVMRQDNVLDFFLECISKYRNADYMVSNYYYFYFIIYYFYKNYY